MPSTIEAIYTRTAGPAGISGVSFNNIPQTFTHLKVVISIRSAASISTFDSMGIYFNGSQANISNTIISTNGTTASSGRSTYRALMGISTAAQTANTFSTIEIYIPNYRSSNFKQLFFDGVSENAATLAVVTFGANLWRDTAAITSLTFDTATSGSPAAEHSTFSLYGIRNS